METPPLLLPAALLFLLLCAAAFYIASARASAASASRLFQGASSCVLVTGAGSGIGLATALAFSAAGSSVVLWDIDGAALAAAAAACAAQRGGGAVEARAVDVSDEGAVAAACAALRARLPGGVVDVVVSNAGVVHGRDAEALSAAEVRRSLDVNVGASFSLLRELRPAHRAARRGAWVLVSSCMGLVGSARLADYVATKWALLGLAESLRLELARDGLSGREVAVVAVAPYATRTAMFAGILGGERGANALREWLCPQLAAADVAAAVLAAVRRGGHALVVLPPVAGLAVAAMRALLPLGACDALIGWAGGWHGMATFKGREGHQVGAAAPLEQPRRLEGRGRRDAAAAPRPGGEEEGRSRGSDAARQRRAGGREGLGATSRQRAASRLTAR